MDRTPEPWQANEARPFLMIPDVSVSVLGDNRYRRQASSGDEAVEGFEEARKRPVGWPALPDAVRGGVQALAVLAIASQLVFVAGWVIAGALETAYSPVRSYISELGHRGTSHPWIFDVSIVLWGICFIALAIAMLSALWTCHGLGRPSAPREGFPTD